ncbi:hypothetical protein ABVN80_14615 [Acinetobacter baumannii]
MRQLDLRVIDKHGRGWSDPSRLVEEIMTHHFSGEKMFRPNQTCVVRSIAGYSVYGQPQEGKRKKGKMRNRSLRHQE